MHMLGSASWLVRKQVYLVTNGIAIVNISYQNQLNWYVLVLSDGKSHAMHQNV